MVVQRKGLPLLYEWELYAPQMVGSIKAGAELDLTSDSYVVGFVGPRGSGKSLSMTYAAAKMMMLGKHVIANYDIAFRLKDRHGKTKTYRSEPLDMYKLLTFDADTKGCIICLDEAPTIISYMASQSWKNRLLNIFLQQLRKNRNSLIYTAQCNDWVDKQLRWQADVLCLCQDASKIYGNKSKCARGEVILQDFFDMSGLWTGRIYDEKRDRPAASVKLRAKHIWECYDSYAEQDVFQALAKVDMKLSTYKIDARGNGHDKDTRHIDVAMAAIGNLVEAGIKKVRTTDLYESLGELDARQKDEVSKAIKKMGVTKSRPGMDYVYDLTNLKLN